MVVSIEQAAADFFAFEAEAAALVSRPPRGVVVFGSERGFCGGFNQRIAAALAGDDGPLVIVGRQLAAACPRHASRP